MLNSRPPLWTIILTAGVLLFLWLPPLHLYGAALVRAVATQPERLLDTLPLSPLSRFLLFNTLCLSTLTTLLALILGWPVALVLARSRWNFVRAAVAILAAIPLAIPPTLAASAYLEWTRTPPARSMTALAAQTPLSINSLFAAAPVLALCFFPLVAFPVAAALRALPREWEEAALGFGSPLESWRRILGPLLGPALLGTAGLVAALSCWEMGAPDLLDVRTYAVQIYRNLSVNDPWDTGGELKSALAGWPMLALGALALWPALRALRFYGKLGAASSAQSTPRDHLAAPTVFAAAVLAISPLAILLVFLRQLPSFQLVREVWFDAQREIFNTIGLATVAALCITGIAFLLVAGWRVWDNQWRSRVLAAAVAPLFIAPLLLAVALIHFYNRPAFTMIYGGLAPIGWEPFDTIFVFAARYGLMLIGYAARFLPLAILLLHEAAGRVNTSLIEAAMISGATPTQAARQVLWPLLRPTLLGVFALVWALSAGELSMAVIINAPGGQTLPVPIFNWMHIASTPEVATLSLTLAALSGGVLGAALLIWKGRSTRREAS